MKKYFQLLLALLAFAPLSAQVSDEPGGIWTAISAEKDLSKKLTLGSELELRTLDFTSDIERFSIGLSLDYAITKQLKAGIGYDYLNVHDSYDWGISPVTGIDSVRTWMQPRHRFYGQLAWKKKIGDFSISFRERAQVTYKDDKNRLKQDKEFPGDPLLNDTNFARVNPDFTWKNRVKIDYNIPNSKFTPAFSVETYMLLNDPDLKPFFSKIRYTLAVEYKINKKNAVELFGMLNAERGEMEVVVPGPNYYIIGNWSNSPVIGVSYHHKF